MTVTLEREFQKSIQGILHGNGIHAPYPTLNTMAIELLILNANALEAEDSPLCSCRPIPPTWHNHTLTHDCHCPAVIAAQRILGGAFPTLHGQQCPGCP